MEQIFKGIGASRGLVAARAFVYKLESYVPAQAQVEQPDLEVERFQTAIRQAQAELEQIRDITERRLGSDKAEIFEGHLMILEDPDLIDVIIEKVKEESVNAEYALYVTSRSFIDMLSQMDDEYLRERAADVRDVCNRIMNNLRGKQQADLSAISEECIVIAEDLTPSDTAKLNLDYVKGFVTEIGSRTSHSAIMARSLGIPAIVGAGAELSRIETGTMIVMDATEGVLRANPSTEELIEFGEKKIRYDQRQAEFAKWVNRSSVSSDGHSVELAANIGKLEDVQKALDNGAEAIGLFRTEFLYMGRSKLPTEDEQFNSYKYVLEKMNGKPVVIRTLDIGGDKELPYLNLPKESNPFLGQRALRFCLDRPDIFRTQLRALLRASRYGNLKIMFPMIAVLSELHAAKQLLEEEKRKLEAEGVELAERIEVGMMIEVPSAAISADLFAKEVDFFSIGTNDLIQYTMAADRMNETVSYLYQPCHPSILRLIRMVIEAGRKEGKWVGMCGEMAGDETAIPLLLGLGLHEFSMSASSILPARELIGHLSRKEWSSLADEAMALKTQEEIIAFVRNHKQGGQNA
ncbi:phosphoenolpyruvate--protein phosphotransferase [Cohnella luojiensis]|uniref:Phosphoenolpyruvate-protein phosphotransferase n=1 Tax=Cohnella luojiensis TaxID=652876 RepID=A0A4Y8LTK3_9BACL|nr:phosphoenolpyruvate--protein phosphotransferase [Cohnella luojiensis]TFE22766.1 phosphoenolpyruvate--protein phosphotransferase [Cohnella luojiensis]